MSSSSSAPLDVLCVGLVCVDLTFEVPRHPAADEKLRATDRHLSPGGPAAVAAAQVARLGGRAGFAGLIGADPFGDLLRQAFRHERIAIDQLHVTADFSTPLAAIVVKPDATRSVISHRAAPTADLAPPTPAFPDTRVILADGHRPEWNAPLIRHARALDAPLVLDAGSWTDSVRELAAAADHVVASEACARVALGGGDPIDSAGQLASALGARPDATVIVTLGERGLVWSRDGALGHEPAMRIHAIDTNGAGDAFHGAYALGLARGLAFREILRLASAAGALACTRRGAWSALADADELRHFLKATR